MGKEDKIHFYELYNHEDLIQKLYGWWNNLHGNIKSKDGKNLPSKSGIRAQLSRCSSLEEVALYPEVYNVNQFFKDEKISFETVAAITGLLSCVKTNKGKNVGLIKKLATPKDGEHPVFSEMRFRKLMNSGSWKEFYTNLRRAISILDNNVNPLSVADIIMLWGRDFSKVKSGEYIKPGESLKYKLAKEYYEAIK